MTARRVQTAVPGGHSPASIGCAELEKRQRQHGKREQLRRDLQAQQAEARRRAAQEDAEDRAYAAEQEAALRRLAAEKAAQKARQTADIDKLKVRLSAKRAGRGQDRSCGGICCSSRLTLGMVAAVSRSALDSSSWGGACVG